MTEHPGQTSGTFDDNPEEEVQYWVMEAPQHTFFQSRKTQKCLA